MISQAGHLCLVITSLLYLISYTNGLLDQLNSYEIVNIKEKRLSKRDTENGRKSIIEVPFGGRTYRLNLRPAVGIVTGPYKSILRGEDGRERVDYMDPDEILHGEVEDCFESWISLTRSPDSRYLGSFECDGREFVIEPRSLHDPLSNGMESIVYRSTEVDLTKNLNNHLGNFVLKSMDKRRVRRRARREVDEPEPVERNRCKLRIIADYRFFCRAGNQSQPFTSRYIVNLFDRVNQIFTRTDFGLDESGKRLINLGFTIEEILILDSYHSDPRHYNSIKDFEDPNVYLDDFHTREASVNFCLVHLLTARTFPGGVLGAAYRATVASGRGICPQTSQSRNTLFSSVVATAGTQLLVTREAELVTAHELGHSFGATHDNLTFPSCRPKDERDGNYIMYPSSVSGYDINNQLFSNCSIDDMRRVLANRAEDCFVPQQNGVCGNGVVEVGEECDEGFIVPGEQEPKCCTRECRYVAGAQCSPKNHPCCSQECGFLSKTSICLHANPLQCSKQSNCTGSSGDCPTPLPTADGSRCVDEGECQKGICRPFCETSKINKKACMCPDEKNGCRRCCRAPNSSLCLPEEGGGRLLDGSFCINGTCKADKCIREVLDVVSHFWGVLEGVDGSNWKMFLQSNIAAFIIIFSLIFWLPISWIINKWDTGPPAGQSITRVITVNRDH